MSDSRKSRAEQIRQARAEKGPEGKSPTYQALATRFDVSVSTVYNILTGKVHAAPTVSG